MVTGACGEAVHLKEDRKQRNQERGVQKKILSQEHAFSDQLAPAIPCLLKL
jgi:hypothetical protein